MSQFELRHKLQLFPDLHLDLDLDRDLDRDLDLDLARELDRESFGDDKQKRAQLKQATEQFLKLLAEERKRSAGSNIED